MRTPVTTPMAAVSMVWASSADRESKQLSAYILMCAPRCAHVGGRGRSHLCAHRLIRRSGRSSEPSGEAGTHQSGGQGRALERAHALSGQAEARKSCRRGNYATCTRARPWDLPNACANESLSCGDHEDMRRVLGRARIEAHYTWLFEWPWRSAAGNPHLKVG